MTEQDGTPRIEVRVAIRRTVVASFEPGALSRDTGIPVEVLLTSFDTWPDATAEIFCDYMYDDTNYDPIRVWDNSDLTRYAITEEQQ